MNNHTHVSCGGELTLHKKEGRRTLYKCDKCNQIVNCIICYSYAEMKEMGIVR
jgi:hypothetical protein